MKMITSSSTILCIVLIQGACGTIFPPVSDDPPRPGQSVRGFTPAQEDLPPEGRYFPDNTQRNEERWYNGEFHPEERREDERREEYYQSSELVVGPVATPKPDTYTASSSEITGFQPEGIWVDYADSTLARSVEGRYSPTRWVEVQNMGESVVENVDLNSGVSTDTVKSVAAPIPFEIPPKSPLPPNSVNIVQVRIPNIVRLQPPYANPSTVFRNVPAVKQTVGTVPVPPPNVKTIVQQQEIIRNVQPIALPPPSSAQILQKKSFVVPPPPPPPLKGVDLPPKVFSAGPVNIIPNANVAVSNKNIIPDSSIVSGKSLLQQVRHVWIPTSSKTGKFITIPISGSIKSEKPTVNKGFSLESTPVTVSDTWILKQDGSVPVFQQEKTALPSVPSPIVQSGKVIFQNPTIVQVDGPTNPIVTRLDSPKPAPVFEKTIISDASRDIWPARTEIASKKVGYPPEIPLDVPPTAIKTDTLVIEKSVPEPLPSPQKSLLVNTKSAFQPQIAPSNAKIVNGKPCPLPLPAPQKTLVSPISSGFIPLPRIISNQGKLPFARIIRVNRYPIGSYYLLNRNIRPSYFVYPNQAIIQQPKTELISLIQAKQIPTYFERKIPLPPVQTKQISIPVQSKEIAPSISVKQVPYPFVSRQVILPVTPPKSTRAIFPTVQTIKYAYPWNAYLKSSPILELNRFKKSKKESESDSSSSESSSEESSESSSSKDKKEEKSKKEKKPKKEEKPKSVENADSGESKKESEAESSSKSLEKESEEKTSEKESAESLETSESQVSLNFMTRTGESRSSMGDNEHMNILPSLGGAGGEETSSDISK